MKKLTKQEKDKYPKIYGYGSVEQLMADPSRFGDDPDNPKTHWVHFKDRDGDIRFEHCTEAFFHWYRNENRNEERRNFREKERCPISIDQMREEHGFEYADNSYYENQERERAQELSDQIWELIGELKPIDQEIIRLFSEGHTDGSIGEKLNISSKTIFGRRKRALDLLREKIKKIQEN